MVRTAGDTFRCHACQRLLEFPDERKSLAEASRQRTARVLERFRNRCQPSESQTLREELALARARAAAAEAKLAELEDRKRRMERQWVNQTLALYQEFETTLRPRVNKAEGALESARRELEDAWEKNEKVERQHERSLKLLARNTQAVESQLKLLKALRPLLRACADTPQVFSQHGIEVDSLFCRAAILKALDLLGD